MLPEVFLVEVVLFQTIGTTGNASDFGDLIEGAQNLSGASNQTRGIWGGSAGGFNGALQNYIQYITIASTGNATDFGDLAQTARNMGTVADTSRVVWGGGQHGDGAYNNRMQYVTISSTGNSSDFGDLTVGRRQLAGASSDHGGLQ